MQPTDRIDRVQQPMPIAAPVKQPAQPKCPMKTGQALLNSAKVTAGSAYFLAHPDFSLFINGMKLMFGKNDHYGLGGILGGLMVLASPVWGIVRIVGGGGGLILGGVATAATGIAYAGEAAIRGVAKIGEPSDAAKQREDLTRRFVARMNDTINKVSYGDRVYFKEHVIDLINISVLEVAFLSRSVQEANVILVNNERFGEEHVAHQDITRKSYFNDICEMKLAIQSLNLSPDDAHGWKILKQYMCEWTPENEGKKFSDVDHETLTLLWKTIHGFAEKLSADDVFNKVLRENPA